MRLLFVAALLLTTAGPALACGPYCSCGCQQGGVCYCHLYRPGGPAPQGPYALPPTRPAPVPVPTYVPQYAPPAQPVYAPQFVPQVREYVTPNYVPQYAPPGGPTGRIRLQEGGGPLGIVRPARSIEVDIGTRPTCSGPNCPLRR